MVEAKVKEVSSGEAHKRIETSLLNVGRAERATKRLNDLVAALTQKDWSQKNWRSTYEICWAEFWDMHALFETSRPSFGYMNSDSLNVLRHVQREMWQKQSHGRYQL